MIGDLLRNIGKKGNTFLIIAVAAYIVSSLSLVGVLFVVFQMLTFITEGGKDLFPFWLTLAGLVIIKFIFTIVFKGTSHIAGFELELRLKEKIITKLKKFSLGFYTDEQLGKISTIVHGDVYSLEEAVAHSASRAVGDIATALFLGIALFALDWRMGIVMVSLLPIAFLVQFFDFKKGLALKEKNHKNLAVMVSRFVEYARGIPLLKAYPENQFFHQRLQTSIGNFKDSSTLEAKSGALTTAKYFIPLELCFGLTALAGGLMTFWNMISIDIFVYFIIFSQEFYRPFANFELYRINYTSIKDSYRRIAWLLDTPVIQNPVLPKLPQSYDIQFKNVGFRYNDSSFRLRNINFTMKPGTLTALVGHSGSGKTTVTNLLLRFWEIEDGSIEIGGINIRDIDYDSLLSLVSIVMQNVVLFSGTIYENIVMGKRDANEREVIEAAKKAMLHDFIAALPLGYQTMLGENGIGLSGGQRQRLSIARAFLKNSPIVLLDEVTSHVDPLNERPIQQAVSNLVINRTVLVIAHHLKTIQTADQIIVFDKGEIAETGTHENLLREKGIYHTLWNMQSDR